MIQILALEPDTTQAETLRRALADSKVDLRVVTDPEVAVAEINRLIPDVVLVGRSVPTGRRDAVTTHAKKAAGKGSALVVLEIPSFRTAEAQERRFLKFGFKKAPAAGEKIDPAVFVEKLIALAPKRPESRGRSKTSHADTARKRHPADVPRAEESAAAPPTEAHPAASPEPAAPVTDAAPREADLRLLAEVERARAEVAEQYQQEMAALAREAAILRDQAVAQAVADAEAHTRALVAVEVTRVRAETDETLSIELARARAEAAHALDIEVTRVRAEHDALIADLVERALQRELERALGDHQARWEAERNAAVAAAMSQASQASEHETSRQEAEARLAAALRDVQAAEESAETLRAALGAAQAEAGDLRRDADARLTAAVRDAQSAEESAAALRAALGQAQAEADELRRAQERVLQDAERARQAAHDELRATWEREAAAAVDGAVATARAALETELAAERKGRESARVGHERALSEAREQLTAHQAEARRQDAEVARLSARLEAALADRAADADAHVTRLRHEEAEKEAAIARARQELRVELEAETLRLIEEEAARSEIARAAAQHDAEARVEAAIALTREQESARSAAAVAAAVRDADARQTAAAALATQDADERRAAAVAAAWQEADVRQAAAVAAAALEVEARQGAALEQTHAAQLQLQQELASARREVEELRAAQAGARGGGDSKRGKAARAEAVREEAARQAAEIEARFNAELAEVRNDAAHARTALEQAHYHRDLERQAADSARQELARAQESAETHAAELVRTREESARLQAAIDRTEQERTNVLSALKQAEHDRDSARQTLAQAVHAEAVRVQAETEARLADVVARAQDEAARAHVAEQQAERTHETARRVAEQALQAEVTRVRAEAEAQLEIELARAREEITAARHAEQQARNDLEVFRERTSRDGRVATESAAAMMLQEEVARVRAETEANLAEDFARMREEIERMRAALHEAQSELDQAKRGQHLPMAPPPAGEPFRARPAADGWSGRDSSGGFVGGGGLIRSRLVRAGLGAVAVVVLLGAGVTMGLPRRALDIWQSIIAQDPGPDSTTPPAADPEAPVGPRRPRPVRPGPSAAADAVPPGSGFVRVFSRIRVDVFLGARRLGSSEDERLLLPSGRHRLRVVNGEFRFEGTVEVEVTAGGLTAQTVKLPTSPLRITAPEGSEISVEGEFKAVAVAPITSVAVEIGTREVLVRHPSRGEKRQSVEVRNGEPAVITIDLDTAPPTGADAVGLPPVMPSGPPASNP